MAFGSILGAANNSTTDVDFGLSAGSVSVLSGNLAIVNYAVIDPVTNLSISDNLSNTWTSVLGFEAGEGFYGWYSIIENAGSMTVTTAHNQANNDDAGITLAVFDGPYASSPLDVNATVTTDNNSPYQSSVTGTLAQANEIVIGMFINANGINYSPSGAWSIAGSATPGTGANSVSEAVVYQTVSSTDSVQPAVVGDSNNSGNGRTLSFKKTAGPGTQSSLLAATGTFSIAGQTTHFQVGMPMVAGTYSILGQDVVLTHQINPLTWYYILS